MNIRDYFLINKTKNNKLKILELLGFEPDIQIDTLEISNLEVKDKEIQVEEQLENLLNNTSNLDVVTEQSSIENYLNKTEETTKQMSTETFIPIKITEQFQKVWSDLESRRKWVIPTIAITSLLMVSFISLNTYLNYKNTQTVIIQDSILVTSNSNELIDSLPILIEISTNTFYSKYDVSNASANLQQIESSLIEYKSNLVNRDDIGDLSNVETNLNNIFALVNELDLVITYRILISEVLVYENLPINEEDVDIDQLTIELSSIIAQSKVNHANLPDIVEFANHKNLVAVAIQTAEDLHGRYLAALRNNEYDVAESIVSAIKLNKSTEVKAFENSLADFNSNSLNDYNNFEDLP
tara:strand:- start:682 stop:1743 length:1062 start_codon:yes stop_codon:yes gene_type:complete